MAHNVLWLGEGGETYRKSPFEAQFPKIDKSFIWKTNFATDKLIGEVLKFGFTSRVGKSKRSLAVNVSRTAGDWDFED